MSSSEAEQSIFANALELAAANREAYLEIACAGEPALRARIERLLAAHERAGGFLAEEPGASVDIETVTSSAIPVEAGTRDWTGDSSSAMETRPARDAKGQVIGGKYTLVEPLGEGGMGAVWRAKQTEPVKRFVAIKLIKAGMDSRQVMARFEAERQALALMDHPNIAKVLDGGLHDYRPYFVMELVKGVPITDYCDSCRLTPNKRLELFVSVCQAIQHAHQKGIIHRDIKPSNVLIALYDDKPVVKIIDFGVAKATGGALTEQTIDTGFGGVVGTPQYMSPEQATFNNLDIDTRSDVYALGVLLYELLTGSPPFTKKDLEKKGLLEMLRVVREEEPPRPSTKLSTADALPSISANRGTEPKKLTGLLRNELDWIVMKALEKDRTRRFETANGFAADVLRYLGGEAVQAHPPSSSYRLKKFVRRNKGQVIAVGLVLLALVGGVIGTTLGLVQAENRRIEADQARARESDRADGEGRAKIEERTAKEEAEKAYARTADVLDIMVSEVTGDSLATQKAITPEQKKFLTEVLTYYQEFAREKANDKKTRERMTYAAYRVGLIEYRLGLEEEAAATYRRALDGCAALAAGFPDVPTYRQRLAICHVNLGIVLMGLKKRPEAMEQLCNAQAILEKLMAEFPAVLTYRLLLAYCHSYLGLMFVDLGQWPEAQEQYHKALAIEEKLASELPAIPEFLLGVASTRLNMGFLLIRCGKLPEAEEQLRKSLAIREKLKVESSNISNGPLLLAKIHTYLGEVLFGLGKVSEAEEHLCKAQAILEKLVAEFPVVPEYRKQLADTQVSLGQLKAKLGHGSEAEEEYRKSLAIWEPLAAEFPAIPAYRQGLAQSHGTLGVLFARLGKRQAAEEQFRKAQALEEKLAAEFPTDPMYRLGVADSYKCLGLLLRDMGKGQEAQGQIRKAITIHEKMATESHKDPGLRSKAAECYNILGNLMAGLEKRTEAEEEYRKSLAIWEPLAAEFPSETMYRQHLVRTHFDLGSLLLGLGKLPEAEVQFRRSLAFLEKLAVEFPAIPEYRIELGVSYCNLGELTFDSGKPSDSLEWFAKAIGTLAPIHERDPRVEKTKLILWNSYSGRAIAFDQLHKYTDAVQDWRKVVELSRQEMHAWSNYHLGASLFRSGKFSESEAAFDRGLEFRELAMRNARQNPKEPTWLTAIYLMDRALVYFENNHPKLAVDWFSRAQVAFVEFEKQWPGPEVTNKLCWTYQNRALALDQLDRYAEAIKDWDRAMVLCSKKEQPGIRASRATSLVLGACPSIIPYSHNVSHFR